jgi:hypothetical protein
MATSFVSIGRPIVSDTAFPSTQKFALVPVTSISRHTHSPIGIASELATDVGLGTSKLRSATWPVMARMYPAAPESIGAFKSMRVVDSVGWPGK